VAEFWHPTRSGLPSVPRRTGRSEASAAMCAAGASSASPVNLGAVAGHRWSRRSVGQQTWGPWLDRGGVCRGSPALGGRGVGSGKGPVKAQHDRVGERSLPRIRHGCGQGFPGSAPALPGWSGWPRPNWRWPTSHSAGTGDTASGWGGTCPRRARHGASRRRAGLTVDTGSGQVAAGLHHRRALAGPRERTQSAEMGEPWVSQR
jgi:hypothetical protein